MSGLKQGLKEIMPPILWRTLQSANKARRRKIEERLNKQKTGGDAQALDVYWADEMAEALETWGLGTAWDEIQHVFLHREGRVLDIACGTGKVIELLSNNPKLEVHGCDISDLLLSKAEEKGIEKDRLTVCDARDLPYEENHFDYAYTIGSLEHFTVDGIIECLNECKRVTSKSSHHQIPISKSGENEGWKDFPQQSFHSNSVEWWVDIFKQVYDDVRVYNSSWEGGILNSKWFVGIKK